MKAFREPYPRLYAAAGDIWKVLPDLDDLVLVAGVHQRIGEVAPPLTPELITILVPIARGRSLAALAAEHDVFLRPTDSSIGDGLLAECWNARALPAGRLGGPVGTVTRGALWAVQAIVQGLHARIPELETIRWRSGDGRPVEWNRERFRRQELRRWDEIFRQCDGGSPAVRGDRSVNMIDGPGPVGDVLSSHPADGR